MRSRFDALLRDPEDHCRATAASTSANSKLLAEFVRVSLTAYARRAENGRASAEKNAARYRAALDAAICDVLPPHRPTRSIATPTAATAHVERLLLLQGEKWLKAHGFDQLPSRRAIRDSLQRIHKSGRTLASGTPVSAAESYRATTSTT